MRDGSTDSGTIGDLGAYRPATIRTSTPDWLFSAVIHLLLVALLFSSKAGPGGGGGDGGSSSGSGNGAGDFPGDGWIEAQMGTESERGIPGPLVVEPIPDSPQHAPAVTEPAPVPQVPVVAAQTHDASSEGVVAQIGYTEPAGVDADAAHSHSPATSAKVVAATVDPFPAAPGNGGHGGGHPGSGRCNGDGAPGEGGGQGGTSLFGIWDSGERIVYAIDRSSSMRHYEKLIAARKELEASLARLDESFEFQVLYYNQQVQPLTLRGSRGLIRATSMNKHRIVRQIRLITAEGGTRHRAALQAALRLRPSVVYFLTDAESNGLTPKEIAALTRSLNGKTRIHCIQFGDMPGERPTSDNWLEQLASFTNGQYAYIRTAAIRRAERAPPPLR